mgnify:CR=1 FL=1
MTVFGSISHQDRMQKTILRTSGFYQYRPGTTGRRYIHKRFITATFGQIKAGCRPGTTAMTHDTMIIENLILHGIEHVDIDISDLHIDNIALTRAIDSIIRDDTLTQLLIIHNSTVVASILTPDRVTEASPSESGTTVLEIMAYSFSPNPATTRLNSDGQLSSPVTWAVKFTVRPS